MCEGDLLEVEGGHLAQFYMGPIYTDMVKP